MINVGLIGYGYWGANILRNFISHPDINISKICDMNKDRLQLACKMYSDLKGTTLVDDIIKDDSIDAVAIVTPVFTHYDLTKQALLNGKHVFVEKPFTSTVQQAEELIEIAEKKNLIIMVDHTFLFTGAVKKIKELIANKELGDLFYYDSVRVNLGLFQHDINVIWDLAPHDIAILQYLINDMQPISVNAIGAAHFNQNLEDVAYLNIKYANNFNTHFHVNWLSPVKVRKTLIAGNKKMLVWDDLCNDEKIKIYDKGVDIENKNGIYNLLAEYRSGDMYAPKIESIEALKLETAHFIDCIKNQKSPINDGISGLNVVKILEASTQSIKNSGNEIKL